MSDRRRLALGLSRELWLVQIGIFLNTLGWGAVLPFEVIYLHDGRGFSLNITGLIVGTLTGIGGVAAPVAGPLIDRFGARVIASCAGLALAVGYAGLALADSPARAFAAAAIAGLGNGALNPSQSTLLAALASPELRHRATAVSRVFTNAGFGFGGALGGLVAAYGLTGFVTLFLVNAFTYLVYAFILLVAVRKEARPEPLKGGYRIVLRDPAFLHLAGTNVAIIAVGWGVLLWLVPTYAKDNLALSAHAIGLLMLANAATVVLVQVPSARFAEGRRRVAMIALAASIFATAFLLILFAQFAASMAVLALVVAAIAIGLGECFHSTALMPLVADLAPPNLRGRYMAAMGLSWWLGLALAPTVGAQLLSVSPTATFVGAAAVASAAGVAALRLERRLPDSARTTPRPTGGLSQCLVDR